jgi:hypothetical protein
METVISQKTNIWIISLMIFSFQLSDTFKVCCLGELVSDPPEYLIHSNLW